MQHRFSRRLSRGMDASLRSALGAITGLVMLLGLDGIDNYRFFVASLVASGVVSYALFEPLTTRISGHSEMSGSSHEVDTAHRIRLLVRLVCIAALAVAAHELFVRGIDNMESAPSSFSFQDMVHFGPFIVPILLGIFVILALTTLSWMLGDEFVHRSRLPKIAAMGAASGALLSVLYFFLRSRSPTNIFAILQWPQEATDLMVAEHVVLAGALGLTGGLVIANVKTSSRRVLAIAIGLALVTAAWSIGVYWSLERSYDGLLAWKVFRCHAVVVFGWIVGLFAGPLGRIELPHDPMQEAR